MGYTESDFKGMNRAELRARLVKVYNAKTEAYTEYRQELADSQRYFEVELRAQRERHEQEIKDLKQATTDTIKMLNGQHVAGVKAYMATISEQRVQLDESEAAHHDYQDALTEALADVFEVTPEELLEAAAFQRLRESAQRAGVAGA